MMEKIRQFKKCDLSKSVPQSRILLTQIFTGTAEMFI